MESRKPDLSFPTRSFEALLLLPRIEEGAVELCSDGCYNVWGRFDSSLGRFSIELNDGNEYGPCSCTAVLRDADGNKLYDIGLPDGSYNLEKAALERLLRCEFTVEIYVGD